MNIYLQNIQNYSIFVPSIRKHMNQLFVTYSTKVALRGKAPCCGNFIVCVHWFSGFI